MLKKILLVVTVLLSLCLGLATAWVYTTGPHIAEPDRKAIADALHRPVPQLVRGMTGKAPSAGYGIWYEKD